MGQCGCKAWGLVGNAAVVYAWSGVQVQHTPAYASLIEVLMSSCLWLSETKAINMRMDVKDLSILFPVLYRGIQLLDCLLALL